MHSAKKKIRLPKVEPKIKAATNASIVFPS